MFTSQSTSNKRVQSARDGEFQATGLDEDQIVKYEQIIDLLLAGGYFRARIAGINCIIKIFYLYKYN